MKSSSNGWVHAAVACVVVLAVSGVAATSWAADPTTAAKPATPTKSTAPAKSESKPSGSASSTLSVTATVMAIDMATRMVSLKGPGGDMVSFVADERVKNLPQVKVGDQVKIVYHEALAFKVQKAGPVTTGTTGKETVASVSPGNKPQGGIKNEVTVTTTVEALDAKAQTVTLKGPKGNTETIKVKDPKNLVNVKVGDQVVITYTEAIAVSVEEVKPAQQ